MSDIYLECLVSPVERPNSPLPVAVFHQRLGNSLDPTEDLGLAQLMSRGPVGVEPAAHMADFVGSLLEWRDSATNKGPQKIVSCQDFSDEDLDLFMDNLQLGVPVLWIEVPVGLRIRGTEDELWQPDLVLVGRVLHVEERPEPFLDRVKALNPGKNGAATR